MTVRRIVFWPPVLTDHAVHTFAACARELGVPGEAVVARGEDHVRAAQGWTRHRGDLPETNIAGADWRAAVHERIADPAAVHIFGSPFERSRQWYALFLALARGRRVFLVSEPYSPIADGYFDDHDRRGALKRRLRPWLYRLYGWLAQPASGVFTISPLASAQFRAIGFPPEKLFPFGYFVPGPDEPRAARPARAPLRCAFVGALIARKGLGGAIAAFRRLPGGTATLDIHGPGSPPDNLPEGVTYRGALAFGTASEALASYDLLIVPSLHDGWGVVVNEALQAGTPVLASRQTGASALVARSGAGAVFEAGDAASLAGLLSAFAAEPDRLAAAQAQARAVAPLLDPAIAGRYMAEAILHVIDGGARPADPWYGP